MTVLRESAGAPTGCVLRVDTGVAVVLTDQGVRRAGYGARMLARVARDRSRAPEAGDWVRLRSWPDGRTTLEECLTRPTPPPAPTPAPGAVLAFRRSSR